MKSFMNWGRGTNRREGQWGQAWGQEAQGWAGEGRGLSSFLQQPSPNHPTDGGMCFPILKVKKQNLILLIILKI